MQVNVQFEPKKVHWPSILCRLAIIAIALAIAAALAIALAAVAATVAAIPTQTASAQDLTVISVGDEVLVKNPKRFGINLGPPEPYAAAQFTRNIIQNPGFEPGVFGSVIHVAESATGRRIPQAFWDVAWNDDQNRVGQPPGFWDGAAYEIVYGPAKGRTGTIQHFAHEGNQNVFYLDSDGAVPDLHDVLFLRMSACASGLQTEFSSPDPAQKRPGSPGGQSLHITYSGDPWKASYAQYFDSYWRDGDKSAGKLLLVKGLWRLQFWAKTGNNPTDIRADFHREGIDPFIDETFTLLPEWRLYEVQIEIPTGMDAPMAAAREDNPILGFGFYLPKGGEAWLDDISLGPMSANTTGFTDTLVARYKELRPGILRFWAEQLGDTLDNQLAEDCARGPHGFSPREREATGWCYSLPQFLQLCELVDAEPWYVIPPTFSPQDLRNLIEYFAAPQDTTPYGARRAALGRPEPWTSAFRVIHLEFGNEMWGSASGDDPFMGASALGGDRLGAIAEDRLEILKSSPLFNDAQFNLIVGGQYGSPPVQQHIAERCADASQLALAPYVSELDTFQSDGEMFYSMFARPFYEAAAGYVNQSRRHLLDAGKTAPFAVYEINFHTIDGDAPEDVRNSLVTGMAGAISLPMSMLVYLRDFAAVNQCAFTTAQYSVGYGNNKYVRLWGLLRDLEATGRKRPSWLGLELANRAIGGQMVATKQSGANPQYVQPKINGIEKDTAVKYIQSFAFRNGKRCSLLIFNCHLDTAFPVSIQMPGLPMESALHYWLAGRDIRDNNETAERVQIESEIIRPFQNPYNTSLPPHSVHLYQWQETVQ